MLQKELWLLIMNVYQEVLKAENSQKVARRILRIFILTSRNPVLRTKDLPLSPSSIHHHQPLHFKLLVWNFQSRPIPGIFHAISPDYALFTSVNVNDSV